MAIELPGPVVQLLNFIGIPWINVNEDKVREFATHVRKFSQNVSDTHQDATTTLKELGSAYQGPAYEALTDMWGSKFTTHVTELTDACGVLATALDVGAGVIEATKAACIAELIALAVTFVADQAAAAVTFGLSELALPGIEEAASKALQFAEQQIEQEIIGQITNAALQPLLGKIDDLAEGLVFGQGGGGGSAGSGFEVDTGQLAAHAERMQGHADTVAGHASTFSSNVSALDFSS